MLVTIRKCHQHIDSAFIIVLPTEFNSPQYFQTTFFWVVHFEIWFERKRTVAVNVVENIRNNFIGNKFIKMIIRIRKKCFLHKVYRCYCAFIVIFLFRSWFLARSTEMRVRIWAPFTKCKDSIVWSRKGTEVRMRVSDFILKSK